MPGSPRTPSPSIGRRSGLKPDYTAAYRGLGRALERAGRPDEARAAYGQGLEVAQRTGDLQTKKEIEVFLRRLGRA